MEKERRRETDKREEALAVGLGSPLGNGITQHYTDSSGRPSALQHCSSSSSGRPGRLGAIIGRAFRDDGGPTHGCLLNAGVNTSKELSSREFLQLHS